MQNMFCDFPFRRLGYDPAEKCTEKGKGVWLRRGCALCGHRVTESQDRGMGDYGEPENKDNAPNRIPEDILSN